MSEATAPSAPADAGGSENFAALNPGGGARAAASWEPSSVRSDFEKSYDEVSSKSEPNDGDQPSHTEGSLRGDLSREYDSAHPTPLSAASREDSILAQANHHWSQEQERALKAGDHAYAQSLQIQQDRANTNYVMQFAEAKDKAGNALRPHFDEVVGDVRDLLSAARDEGRPMTLAQAYEAAIWSNPTTRAKAQASGEKSKPAQAAPGKEIPDTLRSDLGAGLDAIRHARQAGRKSA